MFRPHCVSPLKLGLLWTLRPKSEVQSNLRFSFIFSLNLLKSRVFVMNIMGLFSPAFGVEQAHFSHLTTCLTTCGEFWLIFGWKLIMQSFFFNHSLYINNHRVYCIYPSIEGFGVNRAKMEVSSPWCCIFISLVNYFMSSLYVIVD